MSAENRKNNDSFPPYPKNVRTASIKGVAKGPRGFAPPPNRIVASYCLELIMNKFQNFRWDMSKTHYFSNKFSKIAESWGSPPQAPLNLRCWWPEVAWFAQIVVFKLIMTKSNFKNQLWRHHYCVTEKRQKPNITRFSILFPSNQNFWPQSFFVLA